MLCSAGIEGSFGGTGLVPVCVNPQKSSQDLLGRAPVQAWCCWNPRSAAGKTEEVEQEKTEAEPV